MSQGPEGLRIWKRPAEENMIRNQERSLTSPDALIEAEREHAVDAVSNYKLVAALEGENFFERVKRESDTKGQIKVATTIIRNSPFILKFMPSHIQESEHQAALLVGIAEEMAHANSQLD